MNAAGNDAGQVFSHARLGRASQSTGRRAREQGARDALHALLYQATRVVDGEPPLMHGAGLDAAELDIVALLRAVPSLSADCVEFLARTFQSDDSLVLLKAARVLGAALSVEGTAVAQCTRRLPDLMARLDTLSSAYRIPLLPVDDDSDELLRGSSFEGQFRSVCAGGVHLLIDLSSNTVSTVEDGEEVGVWDDHAGMVRLAKDQETQDTVRQVAAALIGELKHAGGRRTVTASLQHAVVAVADGVAATGAQVAAPRLADELVGLGRASRPWQEGKHAREQGARDALYAMLHQATNCVNDKVVHEPGAPLNVAELEIVALIGAQPSLVPDCVEFLTKLFQSDSSVLLLKAARILGAVMSADSSSSARKSSPLPPVHASESVLSCVRQSSTLLPRMIALSRYTCAQETEDTGGLDGSLRTVRVKGIDYVVDMDTFIVFVGEEEVGTWDDTAGTIQLYEDLVNQNQVQEALLALLDQLGITMLPEEGIPPKSVVTLVSAVKAQAQATAEQAMQLASDTKSTIAEKASSSADMAHTTAVQAEAMAKWRAEQASRFAEETTVASKDLVDVVSSTTQAVVVDGSERMTEIAGDVRDSLVEKAAATRGIVAEKAEDAVGFWQDTGKAKAEQAARVVADTSVKVAEETAKASLHLGSTVSEQIEKAAANTTASDIGSVAKSFSPKHKLQAVRSSADKVREEMAEQLAQERAAHAEEKAALLELARTKSQQRRAAEAAVVTQTVTWECDVDGRWHPYPERVAGMLDQVYDDHRAGGSGGGGGGGGASAVPTSRITFSDRGHHYRVDLVAMKQVNISTGVARSIRRRVERPPDHYAVPETWSPQPVEQHCVLVKVDECSAEFDVVFAHMTATLPSARIVKLERIQNVMLFDYYSMRRDRMVKLAGGGEPKEVRVWHGTGNPLSPGDGIHPRVIYSDRQDGFMMQYSAEGMWGRGLYFAQDARYSDSYAFDLGDGTKCLLLARLLAGDEVHVMPNDRTLRFCPNKPGGGGRYDTVTGETCGSKVYIVYENGRAMPEYLITYTR